MSTVSHYKTNELTLELLFSLQVREAEEGMMLWKRVRHCVVFGGNLAKTKPANS
jgi:hypothetical protein